MDSKETVLDGNFSANQHEERRRKLLPGWIKFFIWIFMIFGVMAIVCLSLGILGFNMDLSLYGLESYHPLSITGLIIIFLGIFKGTTAFSLWTEKDWAIKIAIVDAVIGIAICIFTMVTNESETYLFNFRLELIVFIPYLIQLFKIRQPWDKLAGYLSHIPE